jgi:hypothetical protein
MRTREDIEAYLLKAAIPYREIAENTWLVHDSEEGENIIVRIDGPVVVFRVKVMDLDSAIDREKLFHKLLELNVSDMVHGAYGVADGAIVLTCALRLENLDYTEFQGTIDDFGLALSNHYETLAQFRRNTVPPAAPPVTH